MRQGPVAKLRRERAAVIDELGEAPLRAELGDSIEGWRADIGDIGHHRRSEAVPPEQSEALRVRQGAGVAQKAGRGGGVLVPAMELLRRPEKERGGGGL